MKVWFEKVVIGQFNDVAMRQQIVLLAGARNAKDCRILVGIAGEVGRISHPIGVFAGNTGNTAVKNLTALAIVQWSYDQTRL